MREQNDFDPADFESRTAADKQVYVKFYVRPVPDEEASAKEGRPIYKDREYVEIRTPGNQNNVVQRPVSDMDRQRFRPQYAAFKAGESEQTIGTPLTEVPWITRSQVEELSHLRIRTLEHLSTVNDEVCGRISGLYKLKQRAVTAIEEASKHAPFAKLQKEKEEQDNKLAALQATVQEQAEIIRQLQAAQNAKPAVAAKG